MARDAEGRRYVPVGVVVGAHGVRGTLRVKPFWADSDVLADVESIARLTSAGDVERMARVEGARPHGGAWLVDLEGVDDRRGANEMRGAYVAVEESLLPQPDEGEVYCYRLIGLPVRTVGGAEVGVVTGVLSSGGSDVLEIDGPGGEVLVPFVPEIVVEAVVGERIVVDPPEGLLDLEGSGR